MQHPSMLQYSVQCISILDICIQHSEVVGMIREVIWGTSVLFRRNSFWMGNLQAPTVITH